MPSNISAPTTATAGQTETVSWTESNLGSRAAVAPWADDILLSYDGIIANAVPVGSIYVTSSIPAGQSVTEQATVTIPGSGPASAGSLQLAIVENAEHTFFELNTSNGSAIDGTPTNLPLSLILTSPVTSIDEDAANPTFTGDVTRNGPTAQPLVVTLFSSDTSQFTVPNTVTIPAGQTTAPVPITILDDGIVAPDQTDTITAAATGFNNGTVNITDINTDQAALSVTFPGSTSTVSKGGYATATLTRTGAVDQAVTVTMETNTPAKIYVPSNVTIPAGQAFNHVQHPGRRRRHDRGDAVLRLHRLGAGPGPGRGGCDGDRHRRAEPVGLPGPVDD